MSLFMDLHTNLLEMPRWALWWREVKTPRRCSAGMTGLATPVVMSHRMWQPSKGRALNWRPEDSCRAAISGQLSWDSAMAVQSSPVLAVAHTTATREGEEGDTPMPVLKVAADNPEALLHQPLPRQALWKKRHPCQHSRRQPTTRRHFYVSSRRGRPRRFGSWRDWPLRPWRRPGHRVCNHIANTWYVPNIWGVFSDVGEVSGLPSSPWLRDPPKGEGERLVVRQESKLPPLPHIMKMANAGYKGEQLPVKCWVYGLGRLQLLGEETQGFPGCWPLGHWCGPAPTCIVEPSTARLRAAPGSRCARYVAPSEPAWRPWKLKHDGRPLQPVVALLYRRTGSRCGGAECRRWRAETACRNSPYSKTSGAPSQLRAGETQPQRTSTVEEEWRQRRRPCGPGNR